MKKQITFIAIAVAMLAAATSAQAQFSVPSVPGFGKSAAPSAGVDLGGQQDQLVRGFVAANKDVLNANSAMAMALGLKDSATASRATAEALTEGATKDNLDAANKEVSTSTAAVAAELAKAPQLDASAKVAFGAGIVTLASGVSKYMGLGQSASAMANGLSSNPMQAMKLQSAVYVVKELPGSVKTLSAALQNAIAFAKKNDIPVPADATAVLATL